LKVREEKQEELREEGKEKKGKSQDEERWVRAGERCVLDFLNPLLTFYESKYQT